ncbi:MAG TPA: cellulase family glycosylhydrolase [Clostridia bacterium]
MKKFLSLLLTSLMVFSMIGALNVHAAAGGFTVSGTKLLDANGNEFVMRGINHAHTWFKDQTAALIPVLAKDGCNVVRIVLSNGDKWNLDDVDSVKKIISLCEQNKMITVLEVHDALGVDDVAPLLSAANYFVKIKDALIGKEGTVIVNIANEWVGSSNTSVWATGYKQAIPIIRNAGIKNTIMVDAGGWGQNGQCIIDNGQSVLAADTLKNTMFSIHMYSSAGKDATTIKNYIDGVLNKGLCLVIGEFGFKDTYGDVDEATILNYCQQKNVGWMAWSWKGNSGGVEFLDLSNDWAGTSLSDWGNTVINGTNGLKQTSKICTVFSSTPVVTTGDIDGNGKVNSTDLSLLKRHILSISTLPDIKVGDLDGDGKITSKDYSMLKRIILGTAS